MSNDISNKDKKDWEEFVSSKKKLFDKDQKKLTQISLASRSIDLHGYSLEGANQAVEEFINKSYLDNVKKLIIVTGKGLHSQNEKNPYVSKDLSILKYSIPEFIKGNQNLMKKIIEMKDADIKDGGSGSFYVYLKKLK